MLSTALLGGFAPTARAAETELVIRGAHSAVMDVTFAQHFQLTSPAIEVAGGGAWAGVTIERLDDRSPGVYFAALRVASLSNRVFAMGYGSQFAPGRYRVRLLVDRPATITLPVSNGGQVLKPTGRIAVSARSASAALPASRSQSSIAIPRAVPADRRALVLSAVTGARAENTRACVTSSRSCPRMVLPAALPSPLPASPDLPLPLDTSNDPRLSAERFTARTPRAALLTTEGLRAEAGMARLFCVSYS